MSGVNLHPEGHMDMPPQSAKDLWEPEASDSSPSHLPSWYPAQRLLSSHPNMKHCLEICVTLTEELEAVPPPTHSWMAPSWKICCMMLGLDSLKQWWQTQVRQFFFMGDVQWERAWLQTRLEMPHSYSSEQVHGLENWSTLLQTLWQSRKVEGPLLKPYQTVELRWGDQDIPVWICQPNNPSSLIPQEVSLQRMHLGMVVLTINHHPIGPQEAENVIDVRETKGLNHLSSPHLPQTVGLRATRVCYQWLPWCHLGLTGQTDPDIPDEVDGIKRKELA